MNLLPFVMIIIVILSLFSLSQFENYKIKNTEIKLYRAYFTSLRKARSNKEKKIYKEKPTTTTQKSSSQEQKKPKTKLYFREKRMGWKLGKLNLSSLLTDETKWPNLEKIAARYIHELYSRANFYPKNKDIAPALIKALIKELKESDAPLLFHEITLKDPFLQEIFYKMVRGTNTYDLEEKGYPPFGDFFSFEKTEKPPMHFHYANTAFLTTLLGKDNCNAFINLEKEKLKDEKVKPKCKSPYRWRKDIEKAFGEIGIVNSSPILDLFEINYAPTNTPPEIHRDKDTQITVRVQ